MNELDQAYIVASTVVILPVLLNVAYIAYKSRESNRKFHEEVRQSIEEEDAIERMETFNKVFRNQLESKFAGEIMN